MLRTDRREPTQREIDDFVSKYLRVHRRVKEQSGPHVITDCPSCGKRKHLYLNTDNGLWDCKVCSAAGNLFRIADIMGVRVRDGSIAVVGMKAAMVGAMGGTGGPTAKALPTPTKDAKGLDLARVTKACEQLFREDYPRGQAVRDYLHTRGFDDETIKHWRLGISFITDEHGPEVAVGIPYIDRDCVTLLKQRNLEHDKDKRKFRRVAGGTSSIFNVAGLRGLKQVVLMEAELDAISTWQLGVTNVGSTSLGAKKTLPDEWLADLKDASDVVLWYDDDEAGQDAAQTLMVQLGTYRCRIARMPPDLEIETPTGKRKPKDANDLLQHLGDDAAPIVRGIVRDAKGVENMMVVRPTHYADAIMSQINKGADVLGLTTGWDGVDRIMRGIRPRECTIVTGHTAHGKTTWTTDLMRGLASRGHGCAISSLENGPVSIVTKLFQARMGYPISSIDTDEKRERAMQSISGLDDDPIFMVDRQGRVTAQEIGDDLRYARHRYGIVAAVVDHLHFLKKLSARMEMREHIDECLQYFVELSRELDMHLFIVAHPKGMGEDIIPSGDTVKETSGAKQLCDNGITVYRARAKDGAATTKAMKIKDSLGRKVEVTLEPKDVLIDIWKSRSDDATTGSTILQFDRRTLCYSEAQEPARAGEEMRTDAQTPLAFDDPFA